jgi:mannose-6-phosphate isomerase-like protein (cupin superfamily)
MKSAPFSASGKSFSIHEWRGSGPATLHVHHSDDEAWHVLEGQLTFVVPTTSRPPIPERQCLWLRESLTHISPATVPVI